MVREMDKLNAFIYVFCIPTSDTFSVEVLALWPAQSSCLFADMSLLMLYLFCLCSFVATLCNTEYLQVVYL